MRKSISILAMIALVALFASSCNSDPVHEHSLIIRNDEVGHWSECSECGEIIGNKEEHLFERNRCSCGRYDKPIEIIDRYYDDLKSALDYFDSMKNNANHKDVTINIVKDIDMKDIEWTPFNVDGYHGAGVVTIEGNNHKISNLSAPLFAGGFAGTAGIVINDLTISDSEMKSSNNQGIGAFIECVDSMPKIDLKNCHLINSSISQAVNTATPRVGGLIGWTSGYNNQSDGPVDCHVSIEGCSVESCVIEGINGSVGGIIGHAGANPATKHEIKNCVVKDTRLNSIDDGGWRVGVVVGTANVGEIIIENISESDNSLSQTGKEAPEHPLYGRFVPGSTGKLEIDGNEIKE